MPQRGFSPATSEPLTQPTISTSTPRLQPGVYQIANNVDPDQALDLSGYDTKRVLAYPRHEDTNQKWELERLGPGYTIRSLHNRAYITLNSGIASGATLIATPYPVSWVVESDDWEAGIYRIRWPMSPYILDMPAADTRDVQLNHSYPFKESALWRLISIGRLQLTDDCEENRPKDADQFELVTHSPRTATPVAPGLQTNSETVIDVEGLKLGGNGEMSITTTTTTVTTSVTVLKRLGLPS